MRLTGKEATKAAGPWPSPAETNPEAFGQWGGLPQGSSTSPWQWLQNAQSSALAQPQDFDEEGMRVLVEEEEEEMRLRCPPPSPEQAQDEGWGWESEDEICDNSRLRRQESQDRQRRQSGPHRQRGL